MHNPLARTLTYALDPAALAQDLAFKPDDWQAAVLRSEHKSLLLNCARQSGKSTICAIKALHRATVYPNSTVLLLAASQRQAILLFSKLKHYRAMLPHVQIVKDNETQCRLANGSSIYSLPAKGETIRGFSAVDLLITDESAWVNDDLYNAVTPMLAVSDGQLIAISTPWGRRGWWFEAWQHGGDDWERYKFTALDNPRISSEFLEKERRRKTPAEFQSEYMCEFVDRSTAMFDRDLIDACISDDVKPLFL